MGTEIIRTDTFPCPCGAGQIVVNVEETDHPWRPIRRTRHGHVECDICKREYIVVHGEEAGGQEVALARRADVEARNALRKEWYKRQEALMSSEPVRSLLRKYVELLDREPSIAAKFRRLERDGLTTIRTDSTFRRRFKDAESFLRGEVQPDDVPRLMAALGMTDDSLAAEARRIQELWQRSQEPLPAVGPPLTS